MLKLAQAFRRIPATISGGLSLLLVAVGAWISLRRTFALWGPDSDTADMVLLWQGWQQYGLVFLKSWSYTQDNWSLSLMPLAFAMFAIAGTSPVLVIASGWLIYLACVGLAASIAARVSGAKAAGWLAALLMLPSPAVLGPTGFLAHPVTHNVSLAWGLLAFYGALRWLTAGRAWWLPVVALSLTLNVVSDPWAMVAILLPMLLAGVGLVVGADRGVRRRLAILVAVIAAAGFLARTRLMGLLGFLPSSSFVLADWATMNANFAAFGQVIPFMFNPFPGLQHPRAITATLVWLWLGWIVLVALQSFGRGFGAAGLGLRFLVGTGVLSVCGMAALFVIGSFELGDHIGRFFLNAFIFVPLVLTCILASSPVPIALRCGAGVMAAAFMLAGAATETRTWRKPFALRKNGIPELASFLEQHGLSYGYGPYWGAQANAVGWLTGGRTVIRPVIFDPGTGRVSPRRIQTSPLWYRPADKPADAGDVFVMLRSDGETCADMSICRAAVVAQFGPPSRDLVFGGARILVWSAPILDRFDSL